MPTYKFRDINTNQIYEKFMGINELDKYKNENNVEQIPFSLNYSTNPSVTNKVPDGFRDLLKTIKKINGGD